MDSIDKIRTILNVLFLIGAAISLILYFSGADHRITFFYVCAGIVSSKDDRNHFAILSKIKTSKEDRQ